MKSQQNFSICSASCPITPKTGLPIALISYIAHSITHAAALGKSSKSVSHILSLAGAIDMPFSTGSWTPLRSPATLKRARSDSGLGFCKPASKRTKRSLSGGDEDEVALALVSSTRQQL